MIITFIINKILINNIKIIMKTKQDKVSICMVTICQASVKLRNVQVVVV